MVTLGDTRWRLMTLDDAWWRFSVVRLWVSQSVSLTPKPQNIIKSFIITSRVLQQGSPSITKRHQVSSSIIKRHQASSSVIKRHQASSSIIKHHQESSSNIKHDLWRFMMFYEYFMTLYDILWRFMTLYDALWCFMMLHDASWRFMMIHDACCITLDVIMNDLMMFWGFVDRVTDWLTDGQTTLVVKSLSRLKIEWIIDVLRFWSQTI